LVTAGLFKVAMRASALDIAVRKKAAIVDGIDLLGDAFFYQAIGFERFGEMLCQGVVFSAAGTPEPIIREVETFARRALNLVLFIAILADRDALLLGREFRRCAMLVGGTNVQDVVPAQALKPCKHIRRKHGAGQIPKVLYAIDVGQGRSDEDTSVNHWFYVFFQNSRMRAMIPR